MLQFKTSPCAKEFISLQTKNPPLTTLVQNLAEHVQETYHKAVIVTDIFRGRKEMEAIYGKGTKRTSPHERWLAVDIRDWIYSDEEKQAIIEHLKKHYDSANRLNKLPSGSRTVWLHNMGKGMHFHIQYSGTQVHVFTRGMEIRA